MADSGLLIVISGFSGSGKGTIMKELIRRYPEKYALSISATTRQPREGEQDGREYFFKTKEEFLSMIEHNELLEHAQYVGNYYGTPKAYVQQQLQAHKHVILEIEIQGALKIKEQFPPVRYCAISRMDWILSSFASWIKQQVLITMMSASCSSSVTVNL